jgi:HD-GYP domain-containing protein (c-di-GMP phosphodiesterase class II)
MVARSSTSTKSALTIPTFEFAFDMLEHQMADWLFDNPITETGVTAMTVARLPVAGDAPLAGLVREFSEAIGVPCLCLDRELGRIVGQSHSELLPYIPAELLQRLDEVSAIEVRRVGEHLAYFAVPLAADDRFVVAGYVLQTRGSRPPELVLSAIEADWSEARLNACLGSVPVCDPKLLQRLLESVGHEFRQRRREAELQLELNSLSQQIDYTYEEISLLHRLTHNLQLSRPREELADMCVRGLYGLIESTGVAICLEDPEHGMHFLMQGRIPFDQSGLARLLARFEQHDWTKPLVKNKLQHTLLGADFPGLKNLVMVPIGDPQHRRGWIVCTNLRGGRDFGSVEANLVSSIATILGTHVRNIELYDEHDDLLVGFVRSLVSTLDAKDPYTRGHSERVALVARRLGEQLGLEVGDLNDIYLSGLLHDIGKVGVDDRILAKPGQLTEEEFRQIQLHPMIGFLILQQLKNLKPILPGVRNHHEAFNGKGYPDKLKGDEIPLMARIIAVADSYDAMVSDRPYRKGMPIERLEDIFRRGANEQWDPRVIEAFFIVKQDIKQLCESYSPARGNLLREKSASLSGVRSARTLLRQ